jgi:hypothetical protein
MVEKIAACLDGDVRGKKIGMLGSRSSRRPTTRATPPRSRSCARCRRAARASRPTIPQAMDAVRKELPDSTLCSDAYRRAAAPRRS